MQVAPVDKSHVTSCPLRVGSLKTVSTNSLDAASYAKSVLALDPWDTEVLLKPSPPVSGGRVSSDASAAPSRSRTVFAYSVRVSRWITDVPTSRFTPGPVPPPPVVAGPPPAPPVGPVGGLPTPSTPFVVMSPIFPVQPATGAAATKSNPAHRTADPPAVTQRSRVMVCGDRRVRESSQ